MLKTFILKFRPEKNIDLVGQLGELTQKPDRNNRPGISREIVEQYMKHVEGPN